MNATEQERLNLLLRTDGMVTTDYLAEFYGLNWPWSGEIRQDFDAWLARSPRRISWDEERPSRFLLEAFFQDQRVQPKKWVACQLGMKVESFDRIMQKITNLGLRPRRYEIYPGLISTSFGKDLDAHLPRMKFRTFGDDNSYCELLHDDLKKELEVEIEPELCATSTQLDENPRWFARTFDNLTLEPLSIRHQMFLDFGKPLYLKSDVCSKLFYVQNRRDLLQFHAGSTEPRDIHEYEAEHA